MLKLKVRPQTGKGGREMKQNREKQLVIPKIKSGTYLCLEVVAGETKKNGGGEIICQQGEVYYYHLQYPAVGKAMAHISLLLHMGDLPIKITAKQCDEGKNNFCLPIFIKNENKNPYGKLWHYGIYKKLMGGTPWRPEAEEVKK